MLSNVTIAASPAQAAAFPAPPAAKQNAGQFLAQKAPARQPFVFPQQPASPWAKELQKNPPKVLPSSEPVKMKPLQQTLSPAFLANSSGTGVSTPGQKNGAPLLVQGSDGRLTVTIPSGALDISQARTSNSAATSFLQQHGLILNVSQVSGHSIGNVNSLGEYQFQFTDTQGRTLQGIRVHQPFTIQYHYQPQEIERMGLDPGKLLLTWPEQFNQALAAK